VRAAEDWPGRIDAWRAGRRVRSSVPVPVPVPGSGARAGIPGSSSGTVRGGTSAKAGRAFGAAGLPRLSLVTFRWPDTPVVCWPGTGTGRWSGVAGRRRWPGAADPPVRSGATAADRPADASAGYPGTTGPWRRAGTPESDVSSGATADRPAIVPARCPGTAGPPRRPGTAGPGVRSGITADCPAAVPARYPGTAGPPRRPGTAGSGVRSGTAAGCPAAASASYPGGSGRPRRPRTGVPGARSRTTADCASATSAGPGIATPRRPGAAGPVRWLGAGETRRPWTARMIRGLDPAGPACCLGAGVTARCWAAAPVRRPRSSAAVALILGLPHRVRVLSHNSSMLAVNQAVTQTCVQSNARPIPFYLGGTTFSRRVEQMFDV
jgi:hypothetical protein